MQQLERLSSSGLPNASDLPFRPIEIFDRMAKHRLVGHRLAEQREAASAFRDWFRGTGMPSSLTTHALVTVPYPTKFALWRAATTPAPYVFLTNRLTVVRWHDEAGVLRTLLFDPSDPDLDAATPFYAKTQAKTPPWLIDRLVTRHATVESVLAELAIAPNEVDYLSFDHLHTQDVRHWLGTNSPAADVSPNEPIPAFFPRAKLLVHRDEWDALSALHPLQIEWYNPASFRDLPEDRVVAFDGDLLLGPGIAFIRTPGHTSGNHSLVLNTTSGIWAMSENAIATECLTPEHSKIPGVKGWAARYRQEVVINSNTPEAAGDQYNSMVLEKSIVDPIANERFLQFMPSSELTAHAFAPGANPTYVHGTITHAPQAARGTAFI